MRAGYVACLFAASCAMTATNARAIETERAAEPLEEVVVTGSRLVASVEQATGPVTILDRTDLERGLPDSLGEVLQSLPLQSGATQNLNNNDGDGSTRINLRGLGPERTLVLLNGRRFVFGGLGADASVDLDMIPLSMIERVEISTSGATSIYGSDAVAGVVNVITRQNYSGFETGGTYHVAEHGDGAVRTAHALFGSSSDGGNFVLGFEYVRQNTVLQGARSYSAHVESLASPSGPIVDTGSLNSPEGFLVLPVPSVLDPAGVGSGFYTHIAATTGRALSDYRPFDPSTDLYNYAPQAYLQTPTERGVLWLSARGALGSSVEWFGEGLLHRARTEQQYSPATYSSFNAGAAPYDPVSGEQFIPASNYYNPFGTDVLGVISTLSSGGPRTFDQHIATYRTVLGLRGRLARWRWEGSVTWAQSDANQYSTDQVLRANVRNAVGPSGLDGTGRVVCGTPDPTTGVVAPDNIIAGCVPLNLFAGPLAVTPDQLAYIERNLRDFGRNRHIVADLAITGTLGRLPAGELQWAFGGQYRRESGSDVLDPQTGEGITGFVTTEIPNPSTFTSREVFLETRAPLLRNLPGVEALDATVGERYSRYSEFGGTNSLQGGLHWQLMPHVTLRGGYARVFRAPGLEDLFSTQFVEARPIPDPCGAGPTPEQQTHCAAAGVPGGSYVQGASQPVLSLFGGNPHLGPEHGHTWSAGMLFHGTELDGWSASADYWRVQLDKALGTPSPFDLVDQCANTGSGCALISRAADGSILQVNSIEQNLVSQTQAGVDVSADLRLHSFWGRLEAKLSGVWLISAAQSNFANGTPLQSAGTYSGVSFPRLRVSGSLDWSRGAWSASYRVQFMDSMTECGDKNLIAFLAPTDCRTIDSRLYHDVSASYELHDGLRLTLGVENLLNTEPPFVNTSTSANTDAPLYPLLGRTYTVGIGYRYH